MPATCASASVPAQITKKEGPSDLIISSLTGYCGSFQLHCKKLTKRIRLQGYGWELMQYLKFIIKEHLCFFFFFNLFSAWSVSLLGSEGKELC